MSRELLKTTTQNCGSYKFAHGIALVALNIKLFMRFFAAGSLIDVKRSQGLILMHMPKRNGPHCEPFRKQMRLSARQSFLYVSLLYRLP